MRAMDYSEERRAFFRVDGRVELKYRKLSPEERDEILDKILGGDFSREPPPFPPSSPGTDLVVQERADVPEDGPLASIYERLLRIEEKLDALLSLLNSDYVESFSQGPSPLSLEEPSGICVVNISGGGMRFPAKDPMEVGDYVDLLVTLPILPSHPIRLLGQVVHVRPIRDAVCESRYEVAIRFDALLEEDRERIIRYTFFQQAKAIRKSKRGAVT